MPYTSERHAVLIPYKCVCGAASVDVTAKCVCKTMSEAEGEWADLLHESVLEASRALSPAKPASVPEPTVTSTQRTRCATSPTMAHFFGPVGSTASGAGKGLVTLKTKLYVRMEGKMLCASVSLSLCRIVAVVVN